MTKATQTTTEQFKILDEVTHVKTRPSMFIGSTKAEDLGCFIDGRWTQLSIVGGFLKIVNEIIDNSLDEAIRTDFKHANEIDIQIRSSVLEDHYFSVTDNGRGIPIEKVDGGVYRPVAAWTMLRAGSNFGENRQTAGMNGYGSVLTNIFSKHFRAVTRSGGQSLALDCYDNLDHSKTTVSVKKTTISSGTKVTAYPDLSYFGMTEITKDHIDYFHERIFNLAVTYPEIRFTFNGLVLSPRNNSKIAAVFGDDTVFVESKNTKIVICNSGEAQEFRVHSYVNGLHTFAGGTHINYFLSNLITELTPLIKRKYKIDVQSNHIKQSLVIASWVRGFNNPQFDSQTKERITNSTKDCKDFFDRESIDFAKIAKNIMGTEGLITPIVELLLAKKEQADRITLAKTQKQNKKQIILNHISAQSTDAMLFITEGQSAQGTFLSVYDAQRHGAYSLKGKVLNVTGMPFIDIIKNKELAELMTVIGLTASPDYDSLNYKTIGILTDSDLDGYSIQCLLINFFSRWPKLFTEKRIRIIESPKYVVKLPRSKKYFYSTEELEKAKLPENAKVKYIKGLGTLELDDYHDMIHNLRDSIVEFDKTAAAKLDMAFGNDASKRKEWLAQ